MMISTKVKEMQYTDHVAIIAIIMMLWCANCYCVTIDFNLWGFGTSYLS